MRIQKLLFTALLFALGGNISAQTDGNSSFIHATYNQGVSDRGLEEIAESDYQTFDFIYVMAAPTWNQIDFSLPADEVIKMAETFEYSRLESGKRYTPQMIEEIHKGDTKVLLSFAGEGFNPIVEDPQKRDKFVHYMCALVDKFKYDGIEIDWETGVELNLHAVFVNEIRKELNNLGRQNNKYYYLTTALHYFQRYTPELANKVNDDLDWINIMTYDMGGGIWGYEATHNTPFNEIKQALKHWEVFDSQKLCIGLANYGFYYKGIKPGEKKEEKLNNYGSYISYNKFKPYLSEGWTEEYDTTENVSYYFSPDKEEFVTMENPETIAKKIEWIYQQHYRGMFWWEFHYDFISPENPSEKGSHELIDIAKDYLREQQK